MRTMTLLARGIMVSLSAVAVLAPNATSGAHAQPPHSRGADWAMPRMGSSSFSGASPRDGGGLAVPRGDLRGAIIDNARQHAAPAPQGAQGKRRH